MILDTHSWVAQLVVWKILGGTLQCCMKICSKCGDPMKTKIIVDGKQRNVQRRKFCLKCSPFGEHNTRDLLATPKKKSLSTTRYRQKLKARLVEYKGGKCQKCGYDEPCLGAFAFHHRDPNEKEFGIGAGNLGKSWSALKAEVDKCDLLCVRCHAETHDVNYSQVAQR